MQEPERPRYPEALDENIGKYVELKGRYELFQAQDHLTGDIDRLVEQLVRFKREIRNGERIHSDPITNGGLYNFTRHVTEYQVAFNVIGVGLELDHIRQWNLEHQVRDVVLAFAKWVTNDLAIRHPRIAKRIANEITFCGNWPVEPDPLGEAL